MIASGFALSHDAKHAGFHMSQNCGSPTIRLVADRHRDQANVDVIAVFEELARLFVAWGCQVQPFGWLPIGTGKRQSLATTGRMQWFH